MEQEDILKNNFTEFHNRFGRKFLYNGRPDASKAEFDQVLQVDPLNQNATRGLFECNLYNDVRNCSYDPNYDPGMLWVQLEELSKEYPDDPIPYLYLGDLAFEYDYEDDATYYYEKAIELDSSVAEAYFGLGLIYDQNQEYNLSLKMYQEAVNLSYWNSRYRNNLASTYYDLQDYQSALYWYNGSVMLNPYNLAQYFGYSNCFLCLGDLENACYYQEQQIAFMEDDNISNTTFNNLEFYGVLNDGTVISLYTIDAKKYEAYYHIALTYYLLGDENKTLEYLKKANDLNSLSEYDKSNIKAVISSEIEDLQKAQPQFIYKTNEFQNLMNSS